jgi:multiple sugar transport system ATP-binding protein
MNLVEGTIAAENGALQFRDDAGSIQLTVDAAHRAALDAYKGKRVIMGIRPEHFLESPSQTAQTGKSISTKVDVVEPMGSEIYLYLAAGKTILTARINTEREPAVDSTYVLDVAMDKAHYFDPGTEKAIRA